MSQNYPDLPPTERLRDSRQKLLDRDEAMRSCFEGDSFPTANLVLGQLCYRRDENKLYQLTGLAPAIWHLAIDHSGTVLNRETALTLFAAAAHVHDDRYAAASHNHDSQYAGIAHTHAGAYQPLDPDLTAIAGLATTGLIKRTADGQAATVASTAAGEALLVAANAGAQRTAMGLSDAATTTVAAIRAGVSVTGKVDKAGDTMTGTLVGPQFKTSGSNATATGFKIEDGTDLAAIFKAASYTAVTGVGNVTSVVGDGSRFSSASLGVSGGVITLYMSYACNCAC